MTEVSRRFPAEWETQSAVMIAWPHADTDWGPRLAEVETTYQALAAALTRFQPLLICVADAALQSHAEALLRAAGAELARVRWVEVPYDDTWLRDSGPISLHHGRGFDLLDFRFTGWGGKYQAQQDDALIAACSAAGVFSERCQRQEIDFALEGGAIETDGRGGLLTTWTCLQQRHPDKTPEQVSAILRETLQQDRVMMLMHGYLEGDDTDAHIDTLARLAPGDGIVYQGCSDRNDSHFDELAAMRDELRALRNERGEAYRLYELPWAQPVIDEGRRLAASYANYLIINGAVLVPSYGDRADTAAQAVIAQAYPGRQVVGVPCRPLIWQNGSLHCITMQLPQGVLRD